MLLASFGVATLAVALSAAGGRAGAERDVASPDPIAESVLAGPTDRPIAPARRRPTLARPLPGRRVLTGDFETGTLRQWPGVQRVAPDRIRVVRSPVRQGRYAARFEVRDGDEAVRGYDDRAELASPRQEREGDEGWYSWSTMFAPDFPRSSAFQVVAQWHSNQNGSPPLGLYVERDRIALVVNRHGPGARLLQVARIWRAPLRRGQWRDFALHVKWSARDDVGFVELWVDGVRQAFTNGRTRRAIRTIYPGSAFNYFKLGYYRASGVPEVGVLFHDAFRASAVG